MAWLARVIALGFAAVAIDAAVATVHGPLLAAASAGIGATVAVIATAVWWTRPWLAATGAFLALTLAFAAGTLGGIGSGPTLTGVTPGDAAALVLACAVVAAALAACVTVKGTVARAIVVVFALYAVVAPVASVQHGGLPAAFQSAPLAWTRGTYAAAELLLPLAGIAALVLGIAEIARRRGARGAVALVLAIALLAASHLGARAAGAAGLPTIVAFERTPIAPGTRSSSALPPETGPIFVPKGSGEVPAEVVAAAAGIPHDPLHALEAVAGLGDDLYPGALGGSVGALRSGSANSVDKALLLRDVVRAGTPAVETAFARCTLSPSEADALVAHVRAGRTPHPKILMQFAGAVADDTADPTVRAALQRWARTWKALVAQTRDEGEKLGTALQAAGLALPPEPSSAERLRALAMQHVWLRARVGGTWTDLDPTVEPAAPGKTRCVAEAQTAALPEELYDVVGVRIALEELRAGVFQRTIALDRTLRTADLADRDLSFMFAEPVGMGSGASSPASASGAMAFTPLLRVGDENLTGTPFVLPAPADDGDDAIARGAAAAANVLSPAGASPSPASGTPAPALPTVSGVWMELSVASPGAGPNTVQSPIFDRVGFAARAAHAAPPALAPRPAAADYRAMQTVWNVVVSAGHAATGGGPANIPDGTDVPALSRNLARLNAAYYGLRRALVDDARNAETAVAARPGISLLAMTNSGLEMDVASEDVLPLAAGEARPNWAAASVLAERALVSGRALLDEGDLGPNAGDDALASFARARSGGLRLVALRPADGAPPASAAISNDARARMSAHLAGGASLLAFAPDVQRTGAAPYAYWIVDPVGGTLRDETALGRHQALPEDATVRRKVALENISTWNKFKCTILPVIRAAGVALSVLHGGSAFSLGGATGLGAANRAAAEEAVKQAQRAPGTPACGV